MLNSEKRKVPPDGGYGWVVTLGFALNNVVVLPLLFGFGLLFQDDDTGLTASQATIVLVANYSIGMLLAPFGGPVLSRFGYRKVAVTGAILISGGLMMTSAASQFWQFIIAYSIICSIGIALVMAAFTLAINSFFNVKRDAAIAVGMSMTGLGTIYKPLLINVLKESYGWRYAVLILSAICLHSLVAACLLRPVKWYMKDETEDKEKELLNGAAKSVELMDINTSLKESNETPVMPPLETYEPNGLPSKTLSMKSSSSSSNLKNTNATSMPLIRSQTPEITLLETEHEPEKGKDLVENDRNNKEASSFSKKMVDFFDLTLLQDPILVNIIIGESIAACVEMNFHFLFPFILNDMMKLPSSDIAKLMAVIGLSDTLFRFVTPVVKRYLNKSPRVMYVISLLLTIITRTMMLFTSTYTGLLYVSVPLGITKAMRSVYFQLVIPSYVPIHRLAYANGIHKLISGIAIFTLGSVLTRVRESSGSYELPLVLLNFVTLVTVLLWSAEFLYYRVRGRRKPEQQSET